MFASINVLFEWTLTCQTLHWLLLCIVKLCIDLSNLLSPHACQRRQLESGQILENYVERRRKLPKEAFYLMDVDGLWDIWAFFQRYAIVQIVQSTPSSGTLGNLNFHLWETLKAFSNAYLRSASLDTTWQHTVVRFQRTVILRTLARWLLFWRVERRFSLFVIPFSAKITDTEKIEHLVTESLKATQFSFNHKSENILRQATWFPINAVNVHIWTWHQAKGLSLGCEQNGQHYLAELRFCNYESHVS
jgi:hypothetical protein